MKGLDGMRKIMVPLLALSLALNFGSSAAAGSVTDIGDGHRQEIIVSAEYKESAETDIIYNADISWSGIDSFVYTASGKEWQPGTHSYIETEEGTWSGEAVFSVVNHSNAGMQVDFSFDSDLVTGSLTVESGTLDAAAENSSQEAADSVVAVLTITSGRITENTDALGFITITLSAAE